MVAYLYLGLWVAAKNIYNPDWSRGMYCTSCCTLNIAFYKLLKIVEGKEVGSIKILNKKNISEIRKIYLEITSCNWQKNKKFEIKH